MPNSNSNPNPNSNPKRKTITFRQNLKCMNACSEAREWVGRKTLKEAWETCPNGDWMVWFMVNAGTDRRTVVRSLVACARPLLDYKVLGTRENKAALDMMIKWCNKKASCDDVDRAVDLANDLVDEHSSKASTIYANAIFDCATYIRFGGIYGVTPVYLFEQVDGSINDIITGFAAELSRDVILKRSADIIRSIVPFDAVNKAYKSISEREKKKP